MRGKQKESKSLAISDNIYLYEHDCKEQLEKGDVVFHAVLEKSTIDPVDSYFRKGIKGYFKAKIFDGIKLCHIDISEFCENKEYVFSKNEIPIYTFQLCKEILQSSNKKDVFRTYREHYSVSEYVQTNPFKGKKGHK